MNDGLKELIHKSGTYQGYGVNHEGQMFRGELKLAPRFAGKGLSIEFVATGDDGTVYHQEHSTLGLTPAESVSLWVLSNNHPGVVEHQFADGPTADGSKWTLCFKLGNLTDQKAFRETVSIDLWPNGDISYRYAWGLPGGDFAERSGVRMTHGSQATIPEARLVRKDAGVVPEGDGWYIINAKEAQWHKNGKFGESCGFEGNQRFEQYGINIHVIEPGQPNCHYHGEDDQEDFLVLQGQCKLLIEGQERLLKAWDFVHCPKWAKHVFVGAGEDPCAILMVGGRTGHGVIYPAIELAKVYDAGPLSTTDSPKVSYAGCPEWTPNKGSWINSQRSPTLGAIGP